MLLISLLLVFLSTSQSVPIGPSPTTGAGLSEVFHIFGRQVPACLNPVQTRTVWQIVWACLTTIFICTWVAVHPNIPGPKESAFAKFRRQFITMVCAGIAPEMMGVWALRQRFEAKRIASEFNDKFKDNGERWTIVHGFFIQMGGFLIYDGREPYKVLTWDRMQKSIEVGEIDIPVVPELDIVDKSKGDFLTKLLVVLHTTWFVLQCTARWKMELPLAELEVITLAFAALNIVIYGVWWEKPQGAMAAIRIPLKSDYPRQSPANESISHDSRGSEDTFVGAIQEDAKEKVEAHDETTPFTVPTPSSWMGSGSEEFLQKHGHWVTSAFWKDYNSWDPRPRGILSPRFQKNLRAAVLIPFYWLPYFVIETFFRPLRKLGINSPEGVGQIRVPMFYAEDGLEYNTKAVLYSIAISVGFGALHLLSWSSLFDSDLHRWLWRGCSVFITLQPLLILTVFPCYWVKDMPWLVSFGLGVYYALALGYGIARLTLFTLAVYSLWHLPPDAHHEIDWFELFRGKS